jgi:hypothetical protein
MSACIWMKDIGTQEERLQQQKKGGQARPPESIGSPGWGALSICALVV